MLLSFLQSKEWEDSQNSIGRKTWRISGALLLRHDLPFGFNYLYCPRPDNLKEFFFIEAKNIARKKNSIFLKIDPVSAGQLSIVNCKLSDSIQPRKTVVIDLRKPESEILSQMREKTRYNIRLAERRGVQVTSDKTGATNYFEKFWRLLQETAKRDGFHTHEKQHYEKLLAIWSQNFSNELFCVEYCGEVLAAAIVNFYGNTATYLHGASSRKDKEVMAPHLLHWRIIQEAKKRGFTQYDFGGIDEKKWPGVTRFKLGFGGEVFEYPPSIDIIYRPILYGAYRLVRNLRR